jgi:hypothetical protein
VLRGDGRDLNFRVSYRNSVFIGVPLGRSLPSSREKAGNFLQKNACKIRSFSCSGQVFYFHRAYDSLS